MISDRIDWDLVEKKKNVMCTPHNIPITDCFDLHHIKINGTETVIVEVKKLHLPCGHLCDYPTSKFKRYQVTCPMGHSWKLYWKQDNSEWCAIKC